MKALSRGSARLIYTPYAHDICAAYSVWRSYAEFLPYKTSIEARKKKYSFHNYNREVRRSVCHGLFEKITAREIRDQIYGYLVEPGMVRLMGILDHDDLCYYNFGLGYRYVGKRARACLSIQNREHWRFDLCGVRLDRSEIWRCEQVGH